MTSRILLYHLVYIPVSFLFFFQVAVTFIDHQFHEAFFCVFYFSFMRIRFYLFSLLLPGSGSDVHGLNIRGFGFDTIRICIE
jgi:hypothetical protein